MKSGLLLALMIVKSRSEPFGRGSRTWMQQCHF